MNIHNIRDKAEKYALSKTGYCGHDLYFFYRDSKIAELVMLEFKEYASSTAQFDSHQMNSINEFIEQILKE